LHTRQFASVGEALQEVREFAATVFRDANAKHVTEIRRADFATFDEFVERVAQTGGGPLPPPPTLAP
jgi:hypothetical protein